MDNFLKETEYCDFSSLEIKKIALSFKDKYSDEKELAIALFYFVRDSILYRLGLWQKRASETLLEGKGTCTNKANLLVALLRACNIPAGYGVMRVKGKEYFGPIILPVFKNHVGEKSVHVYAFVFLVGRWIKCDPSDDKVFAQHTSYFNPPSTLIEWDGEKDASLNLLPEHVLSDEGPLDNIEEMMLKKSRNAKWPALTLGNLYVEFLRKNEMKINDPVELTDLFRAWLKKNKAAYYLIFSIMLFFHKKTL